MDTINKITEQINIIRETTDSLDRIDGDYFDYTDRLLYQEILVNLRTLLNILVERRFSQIILKGR